MCERPHGVQAVEIFLTGNKSIMFSFSDRYECDQFLDTVKKQPGPVPCGRSRRPARPGPR